MIAGLVARVRSLWRGVGRGDALHAEMDDEFRLHQELRAADLVRAGLAPAEAARRARLEFGSTERYKDEGRASRGLRPFDQLGVSWLDFKLGFRMLARYPGLTLVGGLAMAFAIWVGAGAFELISQAVNPTLPLPGGERIVGIRVTDAATGQQQARVAHDVVAWREELDAVEEVGAFSTLERNLITAGGVTEPVEVAEISASAFRVTRVRPLLGRALVEADERPGAAPVAVIEHSLWETRFGGDSAVVGRTVRLGDTPVTIVGVMPEGYGFPIAQRLWVPLRLDVLEYGRGEGPAVRVFGRLAPGVSLTEAQAELTALGRRAAADFPQTHENLRPQVMPYARSIFNFSGVEVALVRSSNVFLVMLLVLVCGNVALLMFARAATRESELVVRTALGASRSRIVTQLFAEALVLGTLAATIGLLFTNAGLQWTLSDFAGELLNGARLPFWFRAGLSPTTVLYAAVLTLLGAVIAGVVPALKVTRGLQQRLRETSGGGGGLRFGGIWTAIIVTQVAVTVAFPITAFFVRRDAAQLASLDVGFPEAQYLTAQLQLDRDATAAALGDTSRAALAARFRSTYQELERRLLAEPGVVGVTIAERFPRMYHPHRRIEVDAGGAAPFDPRWPGAYRVSSAAVDADYFDVLQTPLRTGRGFHPVDIESGAHVAIVNQSFVDLVLGGRNPIGRRMRYLYFEESDESFTGEEEPGPWFEIVGVVRDMGSTASDSDQKAATVYHPLGVDDVALNMAIHVRGDPRTFEPQVRSVAAAVDPTLRLNQIVPLDQLSAGELKFMDFWFRLTVLVSAIAIVLSLAGIYAVMSFTVARRTREIGVRVALGGSAHRIVLAIFRRPITQVAIGVVAGVGLMGLLMGFASDWTMTLVHVAELAAYAALMFGVCMLACIVPTRRALAVEPTEALRAEG